MLTGWQVEPNAVYYLNSNPNSKDYGAMMKGWVNIDGIDYYFDAAGKLMVNGVTPDGYMVDANGAKVGLAQNVGALTGTLDLSTAQNYQAATPLTVTVPFNTYLQMINVAKVQAILAQQQAANTQTVTTVQ